MSQKPIVLKNFLSNPSLSVAGENITVLASKSGTSGHEIFLQKGDEGSGPPPHHHPWDEAFFVIEGSVEVGYENETVSAQSGSFVYIPAHTMHWFRFGQGGGKMVSVCGQGTNAAEFFSQVSQNIKPGPPDIAKLVAIAGEHSIEFGQPSD